VVADVDVSAASVLENSKAEDGYDNDDEEDADKDEDEGAEMGMLKKRLDRAASDDGREEVREEEEEDELEEAEDEATGDGKEGMLVSSTGRERGTSVGAVLCSGDEGFEPKPQAQARRCERIELWNQ
jgi:hypothetical protein